MLAMTMMRVFTMVGPHGEEVDESLAHGSVTVDGTTVPFRRSFYGIPLVDEIFAPITVSFFTFISDASLPSYWQSLLFLTEYGGIYAVLLLEATRPINRSSIFQFPSVMALIAQLITAGTTTSLYFFLFCVFRPLDSLEELELWETDATRSIGILPSIAVAHYVPFLLSYLHESLAARYWWNWVWQIYPVWAVPLLVTFSLAGRYSGAGRRWLEAPERQIQITKLTLSVVAVGNASMYWYTLATSTDSLFNLFVPRYLVQGPEDSATVIQTILQYDYVLSLGSMLLWLLYSSSELRSSLKTGTSLIQPVLVSLAVAVCFGAGNALLLLWWNREKTILVAIKARKST
jgi:hypothetical protein